MSHRSYDFAADDGGDDHQQQHQQHTDGGRTQADEDTEEQEQERQQWINEANTALVELTSAHQSLEDLLKQQTPRITAVRKFMGAIFKLWTSFPELSADEEDPEILTLFANWKDLQQQVRSVYNAGNDHIRKSHKRREVPLPEEEEEDDDDEDDEDQDNGGGDEDAGNGGKNSSKSPVSRSKCNSPVRASVQQLGSSNRQPASASAHRASSPFASQDASGATDNRGASAFASNTIRIGGTVLETGRTTVHPAGPFAARAQRNYGNLQQEDHEQYSKDLLMGAMQFKTGFVEAMDRFEKDPTTSKRVELEAKFPSLQKFLIPLRRLAESGCPSSIRFAVEEQAEVLVMLQEDARTMVTQHKSNKLLGQQQPPPRKQQDSVGRANDSQWLDYLVARDTAQDLPMFKGGCVDFKAWRASAEEVIKCPCLADSTKFNRLKKSLEGPALKAVEFIMPYQDNPVQALLDTLHERYGRPETIIAQQQERLEKLAIPKANSCDSIREFVCTVRSIAATLSACKKDPEKDDSFFRAVKRKIPEDLGKRWLHKFSSEADEEPEQTLGSLLDFLEKECRYLQIARESFAVRPKTEVVRLSADSKQGQNTRKEKWQKSKGKSSASGERLQATASNPCAGQEDDFRCPCCDGAHRLEDCSQFQQMKPRLRLQCVFRSFKGYCRRCLRKHNVGSCSIPQEQQRCPVDNNCKYNHHQLLHWGGRTEDNGARAPRQDGNRRQDNQRQGNWRPANGNRNNQQQQHQQQDHQACLPAVEDAATVAAVDISHHLNLIPVLIKGPNGIQKVIAMFDDGSTRTLISEKMARQLGLKIELRDVRLFGIHGDKNVRMGPVQFSIKGLGSELSWHQVKGVTMPKWELPKVKFNWKEWAQDKPEFAHLPLHDIDYEDVHILIGADSKQLRIPEETVWDQEKKFLAFRTPLGWCATGPGETDESVTAVSSVVFKAITGQASLMLEEESDSLQLLAEQFKRFNNAETEGLSRKAKLSLGEERDLERMKAGLTYTEEGRPCLPMLWKNFDRIPESAPQARRRLKSLHRVFDKNPGMREAYNANFIIDLQKGYIRKLSPEEVVKLFQGFHWFLSHFAVFKRDALTRLGKMRRVWDAAAKNEGVSLNDLLVTGPNLLGSLFGIIQRFRLGRYAINADISEMFPQVLIPEADQAMVAFYWHVDPNQEPDVYVNLRQVFGAKCSPANCCFAVLEACRQAGIEHLADGHFYMDDWFASSDNPEELVQQAKAVEAALGKSCFPLGKWMSNSKEILRQFPQEARSPVVKELALEASEDPLPAAKVLGVRWDCETDRFTFSFKPKKEEKEILEPETTAGMLSVLASVFDPFGFIAPFVAQGKQLFQATWNETKSWQASIPPNQKTAWTSWIKDIKDVTQVSTPRWLQLDLSQPITLHSFSDASLTGLGAVVYLVQGEHTPVFAASKNRVVNQEKFGPEKIHRLELQALVVAATLVKQLITEYGKAVKITRVVFWVDNTPVLWWIKNDNKRYEPYVANRLRTMAEIVQQDLIGIKVEFRYVPTDQNPADLVSRGLDAQEMVAKQQFWLEGPEFLKKPEQQWPESIVPVASAPAETELKKKITEVFSVGWTTVHTGEDEETTVADFLKKFHGQANMSLEELENKERLEVKAAQKAGFQREYEKCRVCKARKQSWFALKGRLRGLELFMDERNIMRVRGRTCGAEFLSNEEKFPAVLHPDSPFGRLVVRDAHVRVGHLGARATKAEVRRKYFMPGLARIAEREVKKCQVCRKMRPSLQRVPIAPLHSSRLQVGAAPFSNTGMDHFGPFKVLGGANRWGIIFTCLTSRAVHLEDLKSPSIKDTVLALQRFIARRGKPKSLACDQSPVFVSLAKSEKKLPEKYGAELKQQVEEELQISFKLNPPATPHWGGAWERLIREVKKILSASCSSVARMSPEVFRTFLAQAEAILNRRPLAFDEEGRPISPSQLLGPGVPGVKGFEGTVVTARKVLQAVEFFWKRFCQWFLAEHAVERIFKGRIQADQLQPGDAVLIREEKGFIPSWTTGKIVKVYQDDHGLIRSLLVQTSKGTFWRSTRHIAVAEGFESRPPLLPQLPSVKEFRSNRRPLLEQGVQEDSSASVSSLLPAGGQSLLVAWESTLSGDDTTGVQEDPVRRLEKGKKDFRPSLSPSLATGEIVGLKR